MVDELRPGEKLNVTFAGGIGDAIVFGGHQVSCVTAGGPVAVTTNWPLTEAVLEPSMSYTLWLEGGMVQVAAVV